MDHIPPIKFFIPKINIIREIPKSADTVPVGLWFYSKNPEVTPEVLRATFLSGSYKENPDNQRSYRMLDGITSIPEDRLTQQERDQLVSIGINPVCVLPALGLHTLSTVVAEVRGLPALRMQSLVLVASVAVWVRKLVRSLVGEVARESQLEVTWQQAKALIEQQMNDLQRYRILYDHKVELQYVPPRKASLFISIKDPLATTLRLRLDFSMIAGSFLKYEFTYLHAGQVTQAVNIGGLFEEDEVLDTLSGTQPLLDLKFLQPDRKHFRVGMYTFAVPPTVSDLAVELAEECGAVDYSPPPMRAVRGKSFTFEQLADFYLKVVDQNVKSLQAELEELTAANGKLAAANLKLKQAQPQDGEDHGSKGSVAEGDSGLPG